MRMTDPAIKSIKKRRSTTSITRATKVTKRVARSTTEILALGMRVRVTAMEAMIAMTHVKGNTGRKSTNTKSITRNLEEEMGVALKSRVQGPDPAHQGIKDHHVTRT